MRGDAIRDDVKERVRVYRRGGVHQSSDNVVVVETDEEFAYNKKVKKQLEKDEKAGLYVGATKTAVDRDYTARLARGVQGCAGTMPANDDDGLESAILPSWPLCICATEGTPGWHTRQCSG